MLLQQYYAAFHVPINGCKLLENILRKFTCMMKNLCLQFGLKMAMLTFLMVFIARLEADKCRRANYQIVSEGKLFTSFVYRTQNTHCLQYFPIILKAFHRCIPKRFYRVIMLKNLSKYCAIFSASMNPNVLDLTSDLNQKQ